jgi:hypothetical protein
MSKQLEVLRYRQAPQAAGSTTQTNFVHLGNGGRPQSSRSDVQPERSEQRPVAPSSGEEKEAVSLEGETA